MNLLNQFRRWLGESRRNQFLAASAVLLVVGSLVAVAVVAVPGDGDAEPEVVAHTASPSPASAATRTPRRTATASPTSEVERPAPESLLQPGYVLDQSLEVSLDGSEAGQIVVISHTISQVLLCSGQALDQKTGEPLPTPTSGCEDLTSSAVPAREDCSQDPNLGPTPCWFRAEVFAHDDSAGWSSRLISKNHRGGVQDLGEARTFRLDVEREAVVLAFHYCTGTGSGCGWVHEVVAMPGGQVKSAYSSWQARETIDEDSATFVNPVVFFQDAFCCPSGMLTDKLALDPLTDELGVIDSRLDVCGQGVLAHNPGDQNPDNLMELTCDAGLNVLFETTAETVVEPSSIPGVNGLRQGQHVGVEYNIKECSPSGEDCLGKTLTATKITVLDP